MTGNEIQELRQELELSRREFADFLGVATQAVHRWERCGESSPPVKWYSRRVLELLKKQLDRRDDEVRHRLAMYLSHGVRKHGGLVGMYRLLAVVYEGAD